MEKIDLSKITLDKINSSILKDKNAEFFVLRLDKIHSIVSGNKWFKLKFYLEDAKSQNKTTLVTMGGAWSNHIVATAAVCELNGLRSIGIIRGEEPIKYSTSLLQARANGMQLIFINRSDFKQKKLPEECNNTENYFIDEGGYGQKGKQGAASIMSFCNKNDFSHICCAVGTGTMLAGLAEAAGPDQKLIGISVLKNNYGLVDRVQGLLNPGKRNFEIIHEYHFGGYANYEPRLIHFMNEFYQQTAIPSDFVYTGKLFYAVTNLAGKDFFPPASRVLVIHSGGLLGNNSLNKGTLIF